MFKKTTILALISACVLISQNAFAEWTQADNRTKICNMTNSTTFNFYKSHSYQANTNNDHSANFSIVPQECVYIDLWMQFKLHKDDYDDALTFTENSSPSKGSFDIKSSRSCEYFICPDLNNLNNLNLNGYDVHNEAGGWRPDIVKEGYIAIFDQQLGSI